MDYIIFDLEFNQPFRKRRTHTKRVKKYPSEIIQIGAIKMDALNKNMGTFNALVKPSILKEVHPFVEKITHITKDKLMEAKTFDKVFDDFSAFVKDDNNIFCVWGSTDITELFSNISYHNLNNNLIPKKYINIQDYVSKYFNMPRGNKIGLQTATELLNIPIDRQLHDALNDAYYTSEIFKKLHIKSLTPTIYSPNKNNLRGRNRVKHPKQVLDLEGLIHQFEKMYERKMSEEEISIITLSYKMGMTHQFQKELRIKKKE